MTGNRRKLPWLRAITALLLATGIAGIVLFSPWLKVAKVSVQGNEKLDATAIAEAAEIMGDNILFVNANSVERSLKERLSMIRSAAVSRIPFNEVIVTIKERQPWAAWQVGTQKWTIDEEGVVIAASAPAGLPVIKDMDNVAVQLGAQVDATSLPLAKKLVEALPKELGAKAAGFEYLRHGGLVVITDKGLRARFGDGEDFEYKLAVWKGLLAQKTSGALAFQHVDLRFGYRPFVR